MAVFTEALARRVAAERIKLGEQKRSDAGYGGRMDDGGGSVIIAEADAFLAALDRRWPRVGTNLPTNSKYRWQGKPTLTTQRINA